MIKWLFFDMGSTLVDESECTLYRMEETLKQPNAPSRECFLNRMKENASDNRLPYKDTVNDYGLEKVHWPKHLEKMYPEVPDILEILSSKYKLGIIANQSLGSEKRLKNWGILDYFDVVTASAEAGAAKPHPQIFEMALSKAGFYCRETGGHFGCFMKKEDKKMRMIIMFLLMLAMLIGLFANTGIQIFKWIKLLFKGVNPAIFGISYGIVIVAVLALFVASRTPDIGIPRVVLWADHYALGFVIYMAMIVNVVSGLVWIGKLVRLIPSPVPDVLRLVLGTASAVLLFGVIIYGSVHAGNIQTRHYDVSIGQARENEDSIKIALISDLHLGYVIDENRLQKVVEAVNALQPDVICIAGDTFDGDITSLSNPDKLQELFGKMQSKYGVYACLGNHDAGDGYDQMIDFLSEANVTVLRDETVVIDDRFVLAGRRDSSPIGKHGDQRKDISDWSEAENLLVIVMDHQPGNIGEYGSEADLILCGHTHKGQIFPFNFITNAIFDVDYGYYRASDKSPHVIVTSGVGTWGPAQRVASDSEVVEIDLTF